MSAPVDGRVTRGCLPAAAFDHAEPTATGLVDLDAALAVQHPEAPSLGEHHRDALVLVRLHGEPLRVAHVPAASELLSSEALAGELWRSCGEEIRAHAERCGCVAAPAGPQDLVAGLGSGACAEWEPRDPGCSVAVIVPTLGRAVELERCLRSLLAQSHTDFEAVVVDNRPGNPATREVVGSLSADDARLRYVAEPRPGSSVARNRGVSETGSEVIAFTDDDAVLDRDWLAWLLAAFTEPAVTASTGMVLPLYLETPAQKLFEQYGGFSKGVKRELFRLHGGSMHASLLYPFFGDVFGAGNSAAFRREHLIAGSGFDPALGGGAPARAGEDIDVFTNTILRGGEIAYEPRALCWHAHRDDLEGLQGQIFDYGVGFTAMLTKVALREPRFYAAAARSLPVVLRMASQRSASNGSDDGGGTAFPRELVAAQRAGMLRGPQRYLQGLVRSRRLRLGEVIRGG